ncbi:MAG: oxidoreductase [Gemmatimonadetes bacterium]|nr:MAG: oxidoreductase [Gemmatimonadota bacterium]
MVVSSPRWGAPEIWRRRAPGATLRPVDAILRALAETFVPGSDRVGLAARLADTIGRLPRAADRAELRTLLGVFENRLANLALAGIAKPFTAMTPAQRERYLLGWATSRLALRRKGFQALKRLAGVVAYTAVDAAGTNPLWPPLGYPGPPGPAPQRPKRIRPLAVDRDTTLDCDVVVVGSGAGGGVVAAVLAAAGKDVMVLEKGGYYNEADFTQLEGDALARMYDAGGLLATDDLAMLILQGNCLGGGTVVNYTTSFHPPEAIRDEWARAHRLPHFTSREFLASLDAVAARLGVNTDHAKPSGRDQCLIRGLERLRWHHGLLPRDVRGCPGHTLTVRAHVVVVAGGAIHSPALLLRSGVALPALGRFLALHPATGVFGRMDEPVRPWTGTVQAHYSDQFADLDDGFGFKFETAPVHPSLFALAVPWESGAQHAERMAQLAHTTICGILLRDRDGGRVTVDREGNPVVRYGISAFDHAHLRRAVAAGAELLEAAGAREIWAPLARWVSYHPEEGAGARARWLGRVESAGMGPNELLLVTFHQMASCRMGDDPQSSVVNADNPRYDAHPDIPHSALHIPHSLRRRTACSLC